MQIEKKKICTVMPDTAPKKTNIPFDCIFYAQETEIWDNL